MKNFIKVLMVFLMVGFISTSYAQVIGVKAGLNLANLSEDDNTFDENNMLTGFHVGLFYNHAFNDMISFRPEILFSRKGSELEYKDFDAEAKTKLNYIEIPLLVSVKPVEFMSIEVGPYVGFLVSNDQEVTAGDLTTDFELDDDDLNTFDYGIGAGLTFYYSMFELSCRYDFGLSTIGEEKEILGVDINPLDVKNNVLMISLGYNFELTK